MKLHVQPNAKFRMQPCRFVRERILQLLRDLIDRFVAEEVADNDRRRWWNSNGSGLSRGQSIAISANDMDNLWGYHQLRLEEVARL
jgi:hypothetical protein